MDFTWVTDAAGDITGVTAGTGLTGGGTSGTVSLAFDIANFGGAQGAAGKNRVINGGFDNWQRGTSFTNLHGYNADRWLATGATAVPLQVISRQTITPGDLSGTSLQYFWRQNVTNVNGATNISNQTRIEDVTTFAGQTVTLSFYAKADSARTITMSLNQNFGSGGSGDYFGANNTFNITTAWTRFQVSVDLPSISGKTIGANNFLYVNATMPLSTFTIDWTGVQLELGAVATPFTRAGGTIAGELLACQRYYYRNTDTTSADVFLNSGMASSTTEIICSVALPVCMRTKPSVLESVNVRIYDNVNVISPSAAVLGGSTPFIGQVVYTVTGATQFRPYKVIGNAGLSYIGFSAEL